MAEDREVTFRVATGDLYPTKVTVHIDSIDGKSVEVECYKGLYGIWYKEKVILPKRLLSYSYKCEKTERSFLIMKKTSHRSEGRYRYLPPSVNECRDIFWPQNENLKANSVYDGLEYLLQRFSDSITISNLNQKFSELEHMWPAIGYNTINVVTGPKLKLWLLNSLGVHSTNRQRVLFLCVIYGKLVEYIDMNLKDASPRVTKYDAKKILEGLESSDLNGLTDWCLEPLRIAVKQVLRAVDKEHWLFLAAHFPHLFSSEELRKARKEFNGKIASIVAEKVVIPKVLESYDKDKAMAILNEVPNCVKASEKSRISEVVESFRSTAPQSIKPKLPLINEAKTQNAESQLFSAKTDKTSLPVAKQQNTAQETVTGGHVPDVVKAQPIEAASASTAARETSGSADAIQTVEIDRSPTQSQARISFHVLLREKEVTEVYLLLLHQKVKMRQRIFKTSELTSDTWIIAEIAVSLCLREELKYHYLITKPAYWGASTAQVEEKVERDVNLLSELYDIFENPNHKSAQRENTRMGKLLYVDMFHKSVSSASLKKSIMKVEQIDFPGNDIAFPVTEACNWIERTISASPTSFFSQAQYNFLSVMLGKLIRAAHLKVDSQWFSENTVHRLINALQISDKGDFPTSTITGDLEYVCIFLTHTVKGNWLHMWDYFFQVLGAEAINQMRVNKFIDPPKLFWHTWDTDRELTKKVMNNLANNKTGVRTLISGLIGHANDTRILNELLLLYKKTGAEECSEVNSRASTRLNELITLRHWTKKLNRLDEVWLLISQTNTYVAENVRAHIIKYLRNDTWNSAESDLLRKLIMDKNIYSTAEEFMAVLKNLLRQQNTVNGHDTFMKILQRSDLMRLLNPNELRDLITRAIASCNPAGYVANSRKKVASIQRVYKLIAIYCQCEHFQLDNLEDIKNIAYTTTANISLDTLLKALSPEETKNLQSEALLCLAEHIQRRLREEKANATAYHLRHLKNSSGGELVVSSKYVRDIIVAMIETQESLAPKLECEESVTKLESAVAKILQNAAFWLIIFQSSGSLSDELKKHPYSQAAAELLNLEIYMVSTGEVTSSFLKILKRKEANTLLDWTAATSPTYQGNVQQWKVDLKRLTDMERTYTGHLGNLREFFDGCVHRLMNVVQVQDIKPLTRELRKRVKDSKSNDFLTLHRTTLQEYWGPLFQLIPAAEELHCLASSTIFLNICCSVVENTCPEMTESSKLSQPATDMIKVTPSAQTVVYSILQSISQREPITVTELATLLSKHCFSIFKLHTSVVFRGNMCIAVRVIENMMKGINKENILSEEIEKLESFFNTKVPCEMKSALKSFVEFPLLNERAEQLATIFATFDIPEKDDVIHRALNTLHGLSHSTMTLKELHKALKTVAVIETRFDVEEWEIVEQLAESKELVTFLRSIIDEDLRNLIDAVEERSEQTVDETLVSDLIDVKRYLQPLLNVQTADQLVDAIRKNRDSACLVKKIPDKLNACVNHVHSLKDLYNNVANRGEMTKAIITNALQCGVYSFKLDTQSDECHVVLSYKRGKSEAKYGLDELNDLRSRALLLVNPQKNFQKQLAENTLSASPIPNLAEFVNCITTVNEIVDLCSWLIDSGHFQFRDYWENVNGLTQLQELRRGLQRKYDHWQNILDEARSKYYFLNFFHSKRLWQLDQFFTGKCSMTEDLWLLFRYIHSGVQVDARLRHMYEMPADMKDLRARLFHLGEALEQIFHKHPPTTRKIPGKIQITKSSINTTVHRGSVFVAQLESKESTKSVPVLLSLYKNTTGLLPEPSQVVFCQADTSWEEIYLHLQRCIGASKNMLTDNLYTLVNVELLPLDTQFELVNEIKKIQESDNDKYLLAVICRAGNHHHIIDQFSPKFTHRIQGLSDVEMRSCLRSGWPNVEIVTSSQPGLGKTEYVKNKANRACLGVSTMTVSGPLTKESLVKQTKRQQVELFEMFHIDAAPMTDTGLFDSFLFEIVVTGMAVSGTHMCMVPTTNIVVELANTQEDTLRNALTTSCSFNSNHLEWTGFQDYIVSMEINSPVQVVCHYLKLLDNRTLDYSNIVLIGPNKTVVPLTASDCRYLLEKFFGSTDGISFTVIDTFLCIFAQELRRMSASTYFTTKNLKDMLDTNDVRSQFVRALLAVSREFSTRSVRNYHAEAGLEHSASVSVQAYQVSRTVSATDMVARLQGMVKWAESNHLLVVFNRQNLQTISTLYRLKEQVPAHVKKLLETQIKQDLKDYKKMPQAELQSTLEKIVRNTQKPLKLEKLEELQNNYALTPDNLLKMVLIHMRIRSRIPVIIMGETGCGKTALITYLARVCEVPFATLNLHAGVTEDTILNFIGSLRDDAEKNLQQEVWGFFDEINTCDYLGLLNEVICRHSCKGCVLPCNLVFIAACNPYRLRKGPILSAGLEGMVQRDEQSKLVYRVHPLPESMMDYVWDFGSLDRKDEIAYISRMLESNDKVLVDLVIMSQDFLRRTEMTSYCVSLRDVNRCQHLVQWFEQMLGTKKVAKVPGNHSHFRNVKMRSIILALAHCYLSRLNDEADRDNYRHKVATILAEKKKWDVKKTDIEIMIRAEQLDLLNRMQLLPGTAKNEALRENVFVVLISILNRLPVFVVGKPGCSKSLSMQLIRNNLRGADSKDSYFKTLPPVYIISHQGSESSTSEGILKVFEKAKNYKKANPDVMPVVLLDEIGLAEVSSFNPLKVLHSQLEPTVGGFPPVAVVGISNWALDAAKMNRAIHLSRPEPTVEDLAHTAMSIRDDCASNKTGSSIPHHLVDDDRLRNLAEAYSDYQLHQKHTNFHGLRDYYSLVKYVAIQSLEQMHGEPGEIIHKGLLRNFGGLKLEMTHIIKMFSDKVNIIHHPEAHPPTVQELIKSNLDDDDARHLMLITSGDSALNILEQTLSGRNYVTIFGSRFENDLSEDYNYRILSEIILCMERGVILILRDLESIYGSLYDMLNQNYMIVGKKRNCRVALGAYSNPVCQVHVRFRCIVLVDEQNVEYQNPPFLNRFEKQTLRFSDVLSSDQRKAIDYLNQWLVDISRVEGFPFSPEGMFLGLHDDTLPSLVYLRSSKLESKTDIDAADLAIQCRVDLMKVACPDAVLRISKSKWAKENPTEIEEIQRKYFSLPQFDGLKHFLEIQLGSLDIQSDEEVQIKPNAVYKGDRLVIYTHSSIHTDVEKCLGGFINAQIEKLSKISSERHLASILRHFWLESDKELLIMQCMTSVDSDHMLLAKCKIDHYRQEYISSVGSEGMCKHACIIVHIDREDMGEIGTYSWQFNFLCGWQQFTLDTLEPNSPAISDLLEGPVSSHLATRTVDLESIIEELLLWCFSCIKYDSHFREVDDVIKLAGAIVQCHSFKVSLQKHVLKYIEAREASNIEAIMQTRESWQLTVACDKDLLFSCSTLVDAMLEHIKLCVKEPLARCIAFLEMHNAWAGGPASVDRNEDTTEFWQACFDHTDVFNIESRDLPQKLDVETCLVESRFLDLTFPFFNVFHRRIQENRVWLMKQDDQINGSDLENERRLKNLINQLTDIIQTMQELQYEEYICSHVDEYCNDLLNAFSVEYAPTLSSIIRLNVMKLLMMPLSLPSTEVEMEPAKVIANIYANLWTNEDLLAAELQLISIYKDISDGDIEKLLANAVPRNSQHIVEGHFNHEPVCLENTLTEAPGYSNSRESESLQEVCDAKQRSERFMKDTEETTILASRGEHTFHVITEEDKKQDPDVKMNISDRAENRYNSPVLATEEPAELLGEQINTDRAVSVQAIDLQLLDQPSNDVESLGSDCDETSQSFLVTEICKSILPTKIILERNSGVQLWHQKASLVLILAGRVSVDSVVLHFLRLCRDFATLLFDEYKISEDLLIDLSDLSREVVNPLEAEEVFDFVVNAIQNLILEEVECQRIAKLEEFLCIYFGLCLEVNLDTPLLPAIIQKICTESGKLLCGSRAVLLEILKSDIESEKKEEHSLSVCEQIIHTGEFDEDAFPNLLLINKTLLKNDRNSHIATACCDILEDLVFKYMTSAELGTIDSEDHAILQTANEAIRYINATNNCSLRLVTAAAFFRAFVSATAELFHGRTSKAFKIGGANFVFANVLNGLLKITDETAGESTLSSTTIYLLKCLRDHKALYKLQQWCNEMADPLTALYEMKWQAVLLSSRLGYSPVAYVAHYADAIDAVRAMQVEHEKGKIIAFITSAKTDPDHRIALLAAIADLFYFIQSTGGTKLSDRDEVQWLYDQTEGFLYEFRELFKRLLGISDFSGILKLDESSGQRDLEMGSVVVHLLSIVVSYAEKNTRPILMNFMTNSASTTDRYIPCVGQKSSVLKHTQDGCLRTTKCQCGMVLVKQRQCAVTRCPVCERNFKDENVTRTEKLISAQDEKGYRFEEIDTEPLITTESVRDMSPSAYRVLDVLVHSCFLAGRSAGLLTDEQLVTLFSLRVNENTKITTGNMSTQHHMATHGAILTGETLNETKEVRDSDKGERYIVKRIERCWRLLRDMTFSSHEEVTLLLHSVLRTCTKSLVSANQLKSTKDRNQWEKSVSEIIDQEIQALPQGRAHYKRICLAAQNIPLSCLEVQLEELDSSNTTGLYRLLRNKHQQSFDDFKARFCTYSRELRSTRYQFLQLCLERHDAIQFIRHLPALLRWTKHTTDTLSHNIKRTYSSQTKVATFLCDDRFHPNEAARSLAKDVFDEFQNAWNSVREGWVLLTGKRAELDIMNGESVISQCVVDPSEKHNQFRTMITTLQAIQNQFLMDTLAIASTGNCPSLNFLVSGNKIAGIKAVHLSNARGAIIDYEWSDKILVYCDVNTEYGHGSDIKYNFNIIERELARRLVLNKAILIEGETLTQFRYSDDLSHACSAVLTEIGESIQQHKLSKELVEMIWSEQDRRSTFAKDLLERLEVILVFLKKTGGDPQKPLDEYIQRWSTLLPGSLPDDLLPEPRDSIKLQHVVHLYEILEDKLVGLHILSLSDGFRKPIPDQVEGRLQEKIKPCITETLTELASLIQRFVFRYLRYGVDVAIQHMSLTELMARSAGNKMDCSKAFELLPVDLTVGHVVKVLEVINNQIKLLKKDAERQKDIPRNIKRRPGRKRRGGILAVC